MSEPHPASWKIWLSRFAPYAIAALALAWVFHTTDLKALKAAMAHAPIGVFVAMSAIMLLFNCAADTFAMHRVFGWFGCKVPYRNLFLIRASTYLLAVINYHVGQAAIVGYLYRARRVPLVRASGWILFIIGINVGTLFLLASVGASRASGDIAILRWLPVATLAGAVSWAILLALRPRILVERRVLAPLFEMGISGHLRGVLVRLPHVGVLCAWHFMSLRLFGIKVPPLDALMYLPIYFAAANIPLISMQGLGAAQLVAIQFFAPYALDAATARATVTAYSLSTSVVSILLTVSMGLLALGPATQLGLPTEAPEDFEAEAAHEVAVDAAAALHETATPSEM
jgi:hypothetical protein